MLFQKTDLIVGLTTFHTEMLRISVPALAKIKGRFLLVIHNDNPSVRLTSRDIRKLGYRGRLRIINSDTNVGLLYARMAIIRETMRDTARWITFVNDDDILTDVTIPHVGNDTFAVIQNAVAVHTRVADLMRGKINPDDIDGANIALIQPHVGMAGTLIRTDVARWMRGVASAITDAIDEIDADLDYMPPADTIMWSFANAYAKYKNPGASPIFMDKVNYIKNALDTAVIKYGRPVCPLRNPATQYAHAIARYDAAFAAAADAAK